MKNTRKNNDDLIEEMRSDLRDKQSYIQSVEADERRECERRKIAEKRVERMLERDLHVVQGLVRDRMELVARITKIDMLIKILGYDPIRITHAETVAAPSHLSFEEETDGR